MSNRGRSRQCGRKGFSAEPPGAREDSIPIRELRAPAAPYWLGWVYNRVSPGCKDGVRFIRA
jgi:hypothetical protein